MRLQNHLENSKSRLFQPYSHYNPLYTYVRDDLNQIFLVLRANFTNDVLFHIFKLSRIQVHTHIYARTSENVQTAPAYMHSAQNL